MNRYTLIKLLFAFGSFLAIFAASLTVTPVKDAKAGDEPRIQEAVPKESTTLQPIPEAQAARDAYLDLIKQKVRLMTQEQLTDEMNQLRQEIVELEANLKLRETQTQLRKIIQQFPNSSAAARAKSMLDASTHQRIESQPPVFRNSSSSPYELNNTPDSNFLNGGKVLVPTPVNSHPTY